MDILTLKEILENHVLWLEYKNKGQRANLVGANLKKANLKRANLERANLEGAYLVGANLVGANLKKANLKRANLERANLERAYLVGAYLEGANLVGVNLEGANLEGANLERANLKGANLKGAYLPHFQIVPSEGSFIAWKKTTNGVIKILIPEDAKRTSSLIGRKCRASKIVVLEGIEGNSPTNDTKLFYKIGTIVVADSFDDDICVECTHGIHFFMTEREAQEW